MEEEVLEIGQFEIENRLRNLCWTVSGDYALNLKLDTLSYSKSVYVSLYDAIKQGAFSKYFDRDAFGLYLVKKLYCGGEEQPLTSLAQLPLSARSGFPLCRRRFWAQGPCRAVSEKRRICWRSYGRRRTLWM